MTQMEGITAIKLHLLSTIIYYYVDRGKVFNSVDSSNIKGQNSAPEVLDFPSILYQPTNKPTPFKTTLVFRSLSIFLIRTFCDSVKLLAYIAVDIQNA